MSALLAAVLPFPGGGTATELRFSTLTMEQGLSENSITAIAEDRWGFVWVGTQHGLNRFDGLQFKVFGGGEPGPHRLLEGYVNTLLVDAGDQIWIGTFGGGLARFDPHQGLFHNHLHEPDNPDSLAHNDVSALHLGPDGVLWIGTRGGGLHRMEPDSRRIQRIALLLEEGGAREPVDRISALAGDDSGGLWLGTQGRGLLHFDPANGHVRRLAFADAGDSADTPAPADEISALAVDAHDALWIGTRRSGLMRRASHAAPGRGPAPLMRHYRHDPAVPDSLPHDAINDVHAEAGGTVWIATAQGIARYLPEQDGFRTDRAAPADPLALPHHEATALLVDRSGMLWAGTPGSGLARQIRPNRRFVVHQHQPGDPDSLSEGGVWSVLEDAHGALWIGTAGNGLQVLRPGADGFVRYRAGTHADSLSDDDVRALVEDSDGRLWIGTRHGLNVLDPCCGSASFTRYASDPSRPGSLSHDFVRSLLRTRDGSLWVGTYGGGLNRRDPHSGRFAVFRHDPADPHSLSDDRIYSLREAADGSLWVGTHGGGLNRFDPVSGRAVRYRHDPRRPDSLASDRVLSLWQEPGQALWVGTAAGLDRFEPQPDGPGRFVHHRELPNNVILGLAGDAGGALWMSTNAGLLRFDPARGALRQYLLRDQLRNPEFNGGAAAGGASGRLYFGGVEGVVVVDPTIEEEAAQEVTAMFTDFLVFNRPMAVAAVDPASPLQRPVEFSERVELTHHQGMFGVAFAALRSPDPLRNRFAYRLDGLDREWIPAAAQQRVATYTNLAPGAYRFRLRVSDVDGVWLPQEAGLDIVMQPPLWRTAWAYALYVLLAGALLGYVWRLRQLRERLRREALATLRRSNEELDARVAERTHKLAEANLRLEDASQTDPLTGLRNRRYLAMQIPKDLAFYAREHAQDGSRAPAIVFAIVDIDHFKRINDTHGHASGDRVLQQFASVLLRLVRTGDYVARWGGEEFLLVFRPTPPGRVPLLGGRICSAVSAEAFDIGSGEPLRISCSVGLVEFPPDFENAQPQRWEQLIELADRALYQVKRHGRNGWACFRPAPGVAVSRLLALLHEDEAGFAARPELELLSGGVGGGPP